MSSLSSFDSPLFVRDQRRRYRLANADQVLEAARWVVDQRMQRGTSFKDPSVARQFFRDKLAGGQPRKGAAAIAPLCVLRDTPCHEVRP